VQGKIPVFLDSGVRCGADIFKALALGAKAVGIGRPWVYGLALAGDAGVQTVMDYLAAELDLMMALNGYRTPTEIKPDALAPS
jgi:isopentenyl diphosphate isomerase/L-lactate dehydrogenase-like FMN-dependent dehydrogenase